jgi:transposase
VLASPKVFCDDTTMPVLDRRRRHTRTARFWSYAIDDRPWQGPAPPAVVYIFAEDRKGKHVHEHLSGFSGVLQVDGYAGYGELTKPDRPGGPVTLACCLAHARRQSFEIYEPKPGGWVIVPTRRPGGFGRDGREHDRVDPSPCG